MAGEQAAGAAKASGQGLTTGQAGDRRSAAGKMGEPGPAASRTDAQESGATKADEQGLMAGNAGEAGKAGKAGEILDESELAAIYDEAEAMDALGTGITGGDPMDVPQRVLQVIRGLKSRFGWDHQIHMYTSGRFETRYIDELEAAGLDEIRFHPPPSMWTRLPGTPVDQVILKALTTSMNVGVEVPSLPGHRRQLDALVRYLEAAGVAFLNLNELEISDTNYERLVGKGLARARTDISYGVAGSEELALEYVDDHEGALAVHYCSSGYKDAVQLRERLIRRARNTARPYEELTADGTIIKGVIEVPDGQNKASMKKALDTVMELLFLKYDLPPEMLGVDSERHRIELPADILRDIAPELNRLNRLNEPGESGKSGRPSRPGKSSKSDRQAGKQVGKQVGCVQAGGRAVDNSGRRVAGRQAGGSDKPGKPCRPGKSEWSCFIVEELPTATRQEMEREPL